LNLLGETREKKKKTKKKKKNGKEMISRAGNGSSTLLVELKSKPDVG
jgi:hypothetical protein